VTGRSKEAPPGSSGKEMTIMDDNKLKALLDDIESRRRQAESAAQINAMDYVESNDAQARASSQQYLHVAALWREAAALVRKHLFN